MKRQSVSQLLKCFNVLYDSISLNYAEYLRVMSFCPVVGLLKRKEIQDNE